MIYAKNCKLTRKNYSILSIKYKKDIMITHIITKFMLSMLRPRLIFYLQHANLNKLEM